MVDHKILETAQSSNSSFPLGLDFGLGLGLVNIKIFDVFKNLLERLKV